MARLRGAPVDARPGDACHGRYGSRALEHGLPGATVSAATRHTVAAITLHRVRPGAYVIRAGSAYLVVIGTLYRDARGKWHGRTIDNEAAWPLSTYGRDRDDIARAIASAFYDWSADAAPVTIGAHVRPDDTAAQDAAHYGLPALAHA
jgi:hypothetical protein